MAKDEWLQQHPLSKLHERNTGPKTLRNLPPKPARAPTTLFFSRPCTTSGNWHELKPILHNESELKKIRCAKPVFGSDKYMGQRFLSDLDITFCQIPYEIDRLG